MLSSCFKVLSASHQQQTQLQALISWGPHSTFAEVLADAKPGPRPDAVPCVGPPSAEGPASALQGPSSRPPPVPLCHPSPRHGKCFL